MSRDAVDRLLRHGGPDDRVADGGRAGSGFAHLGSWRRGAALERSYERGEYEQRHEVRVLPGHSEHPRHDAMACLVQQPEGDCRVAHKQPGAAEVLGAARGAEIACLASRAACSTSWRSVAYRDAVPLGIRKRRRPRELGTPWRHGQVAHRSDSAAERVWPVVHKQAELDPSPVFEDAGPRR